MSFTVFGLNGDPRVQFLSSFICKKFHGARISLHCKAPIFSHDIYYPKHSTMGPNHYSQYLGCDTFGPKHIWSPDIWSPTIGPKLIGPSGQTVPNQFCPHGQMVPKNLVPMDKWSPTNLVPLEKWSLEYSVCPGGKL